MKKCWVGMVGICLVSTVAVAQDRVIPLGREAEVQALLAPVGFDAELEGGWRLENITIAQQIIELEFKQAEGGRSSILTIAHPKSGGPGERVGPVLLAGDAPEEVRGPLVAALSTKTAVNLWVPSSRADARSGDSELERVFENPWTPLVFALGGALVVFVVVQRRRGKEDVSEDA